MTINHQQQSSLFTEPKRNPNLVHTKKPIRTMTLIDLYAETGRLKRISYAKWKAYESQQAKAANAKAGT